VLAKRCNDANDCLGDWRLLTNIHILLQQRSNSTWLPNKPLSIHRRPCHRSVGEEALAGTAWGLVLGEGRSIDLAEDRTVPEVDHIDLEGDRIVLEEGRKTVRRSR
jgi:hypothetical protein